MTPRRLIWGFVVLATVVSSRAVPWPEDLAEAGPFLLLAVVLAAGLVVELMIGVLAPRGPSRTEPPAGARAADGVVGIAPVVGVRTEPNPVDPRFCRFIALGPDAAGSLAPPASEPPPLLGRVVIFAIFVGKDGTSWTDGEIAEAHRQILRAGAWLERQAKRWEAAVNVDLAETYFVGEDHAVEEIELARVEQPYQNAIDDARGTVKEISSANRVAGRLGFRDIAELFARIGPRVEADHRVWLLLPRSAGTPCEIDEKHTGIPGVRLAICFADEDSPPRPLIGPPWIDPVSVVHELLHLFGAQDKYGTRLSALPIDGVTPADVMRLDKERLGEIQVDPGTAAEIGWTGPPGNRRRPPRTRSSRRASG
jgi:hypothetical protein